MPKLPALTSKRAVVPFHVKDLQKGTLAAIVREAGIDRNDLLKS